jgi:hypothetical protein
MAKLGNYPTNERRNKMTIQEKALANGIRYLSHYTLSYGDYDNSGVVERANVRYLKEHEELKDSLNEEYSMNDWNRGDYLSNERNADGFHVWQSVRATEKLVETYGGFGSIQLWVREDIWKELELDSLDSYCVLNDELVSQIEMELENKAWKNNTKDSLLRTLSDEPTEEQLASRDVHCQGCDWCGVAEEVITDDIIYDALCPSCKKPYMLSFEEITLPTLREFASELSDDVLWNIYRECQEAMNEYGEVGSGGIWYINIDNLADEFKTSIENLYDEQYETNN